MEHQMTTQQVRTNRANAVLSWFVNPDDPDNAFATINAAYAAADAALPAGGPIIIKLKPGINHALVAGSLSLTADRDLVIDGQGDTNLRGGTTTITGDFDMPADVSVGARRVFMLKDADLVGNITEGSNWFFYYRGGCYRPTGPLSRTHGANAAQTLFENVVVANASSFTVADVDGHADGDLMVFNSMLNSSVDAATVVSIRAATRFILKNVEWQIVFGPTAPSTLIDFNAVAAVVQMSNTSIYASTVSDAPTIFGNNASGKLYNYGQNRLTFATAVGIIASTAAFSTLIGNLNIHAAAVASPFVRLSWHDTRTNEILTWNGTYWVVGDLVRVETVVNVGGAAADHDIGWNVPTGFAVVKASVRLLKAITGAGGAVKVGFGTKVAGDPNKYALTGALTANQTDQTLNPTYNDGSGDDLALTGCDAAGAALGTLAGSGASDVRTMVWMRPPVTLAS